MFSDENLKTIERKVMKSGFKPDVVGFFKGRDGKDFITKEITDFKLFKRVTPLNEYLSNLTEYGLDFKNILSQQDKGKWCSETKNGSKNDTFEWHISNVPLAQSFTSPSNQGSERGVNDLYGKPKAVVDPRTPHTLNSVELANFNDFESLRNIRSEKESLVIGFDTEFYGVPREILSYQFSVYLNGLLYEFLFLRTTDMLLSLDLALAVILNDLGFDSLPAKKYTKCKACVGFDSNGNAKWELFDEYWEVVENSDIVHPLLNGEPMPETIEDYHDKGLINKYSKIVEREWTWFKPAYVFPKDSKIDVTLVCHAGKVDLSALFFKNEYDNIMRYCSEVQGGTVTLQPLFRTFKYVSSIRNALHVFPVNLSVRDTMAQAPAGKKSLAVLGDALKIPKLNIFGFISRMDKLLLNNPRLYFEYSMRDSTVTMLYVSALYGFNKYVSVSLTSATANVMMSYMKGVLNVGSKDEFNRKYRGIEPVKKGKVKRSDGPGFLDATNLEPINRLAGEVQQYCSAAYHGGYNGSSLIGYFEGDTFDYDLKSAYPTAMALVPDIDWENPVVNEIIRERLSLRYFTVLGRYNPVMPMVAYIRFKFPDSVKFPCIPVNVEGNLVFPRSSDGMDGVYAMGPEIFLALKLGAEIFCERGFILSALMCEDGESRSLAHAVHDLVRDRGEAKERFGNKSLEDLILKTMVNSGYGKNAQNVVSKTTWSAYKEEMESLGCSAITNPFSAALTTSIVRAELLSTQNLAHEAGFKMFSVTTDGFITNMSEDVLNSLGMYGLEDFIKASRTFLTDGSDSEIWEIKHSQSRLLNLTTRGNMALNAGGVSAHNSTKSPYPSDSEEDRLWFTIQALKREGPVSYQDSVWTTFKDLARGSEFIVKTVERKVRMDFDFKRKPVKESFETVHPVIKGVKYEIANFDTEPYETVDEFRNYRSKKEQCSVLRTEKHWEVFWLKLKYNSLGRQIRDLKWAKLNSCVMGHRRGFWNIEFLDDVNNTVKDKCEWLNSFNLCDKKFKPSDWKNARRPERTANMLPQEDIQDFLEILGAKNYTPI